MSRDLGVGVSTIYRVLETNEVPSRTTGTSNWKIKFVIMLI